MAGPRGFTNILPSPKNLISSIFAASLKSFWANNQAKCLLKPRYPLVIPLKYQSFC